MPLGFERLNERQQRPNANINFIKPLETADKAIAEDFLQRIAAQCYPVMKKNHITVMSLEEYPPNPEFLGRNFNAGEVIQLVLKDKSGRWLSMRFVQMVMMHELAHCKQMNHSRFFWNVRNEYAKEMEELWRQKYVGEGMWGRGRGLNTGSFVHDRPPDNSEIPEHLCGGSYRRRGRKRKRGADGSGDSEKLTYAERQQRRIARKFGKHGEGSSLGDDELLRGALETMNGGKRGTGKPRVANSKRGRELRANAALARFEQNKIKKEIKKEETYDGSETESDWEDNDRPRVYAEDGVRIKDERGHDLIKVCGDEGEDEQGGAQDEMNELRQLGCVREQTGAGNRTVKVEPPDESETETEADDFHVSKDVLSYITKSKGHVAIAEEGSETESENDDDIKDRVQDVPALSKGSLGFVHDNQPESSDAHADPVSVGPTSVDASAVCRSETTATTSRTSSTPTIAAAAVSASSSLICPICSLENIEVSPTCIACSHVLLPHLIPNHWRCQSETCKASAYINAGDVGRCNLCGAQKPKSTSGPHAGSDQGLGMTRAEILRWD
jgi:hypothetical protein